MLAWISALVGPDFDRTLRASLHIGHLFLRLFVKAAKLAIFACLIQLHIVFAKLSAWRK
ncbi:MAG: hypothetical protein OJF50_005089 [Nitrospira sp.]|jgi:hypothetical protein|nr:hypothetical protein [Nitrospira sp.]